MKTNIKHHAINWSDGMKLSQRYFSANDAHMHDMIRDAASVPINSFNYGLMPRLEGMSSSLKLIVNNHPSSHVELVLEYCNAVTSNGTRIIYIPELYENDNPRLSISAADMDGKQEASFNILVNINPFKNIPIGTPDPEEIPLRHPYSFPEVSLQSMPASQTNNNFIGAFQFLIGEIQWKNSNFSWHDAYIPPCTSIASHPTLEAVLEETQQIFSQLKEHATTIIRKNSFGKPVNNKLAENTCGICTVILEFIASNIFEFRQILKNRPPVYYINKISILANLINTFLIQTKDREKEELLQYYHEWENVRPVDFESVLGELMELNYNHTDIQSSLKSVKKFLGTLLLLWGKLSQLEYVGQRKDNIVIREEVQMASGNGERRWSLLD